jgi:hypothetical protein
MSLANQPVRALNAQKTSSIYYQGVATLAAGGAGTTVSIPIPFLDTVAYAIFIQTAIGVTVAGTVTYSITSAGLIGAALVIGTNNVADVGDKFSVLVTTVAN